jgi:hypothetical protein
MKGSLVGLLGLSCQYKRFLCSLSCSSWPSTKYIFPYRTLFQWFVSIAQQAGQTAVLGRLKLSMCLWPLVTTSCCCAAEFTLCSVYPVLLKSVLSALRSLILHWIVSCRCALYLMLIVLGVCWNPEPIGLVLLSANKIAKIFKHHARKRHSKVLFLKSESS